MIESRAVTGKINLFFFWVVVENGIREQRKMLLDVLGSVARIVWGREVSTGKRW